MKFLVFSLLISQFAQAQTVMIDADKLKAIAFSRCQIPFQAAVVAPIPMLDPPADGQIGSLGMTFQEELAVKTTNLLDQQGFYFTPVPRAAVSQLPMDIYVETAKPGIYALKKWSDANPDYSSPIIQPPISKDLIPPAGQVLTELIVGHVSPMGDYPELFDLRSNAYWRFAGFPPQVAGASLRLGGHNVFGPRIKPGTAEDFPIVRAIYMSLLDPQTARAYVMVENELFCGALAVYLSPLGNNAQMVVDGYWYTRRDFKWREEPHTGLLAYSSMFWKSEQQDSSSTTDSAHDSDTMIVKLKNGKQRRYRLAPPLAGIDVHNLTPKQSISGWVLANEDRNPSHYADFQARLGKTNYNFRSSYDVAILKSNVRTGVSLFEQATNGEYADNIVALSTLRQNITKSKSIDDFVHFKFQTTAFYPPAPVQPTAAGPDDCEFIRQKLSGLPATGGDIAIPQGTFNCRSMIVVKASHVKLHGAGQSLTTLRLADQFPAPVLVVGDDRVIQDANGNWITATKVVDVEISDLTIDGNVLNQDVHNECGAGSCDGDVQAIRNNAITIRGAANVTVRNVTTHSAISGGLVTEKYCDHLHISGFTSYDNHFDGFAGYQTQNSLFENVDLSRNHGAGISIDIDFDNNTFSGGTLSGNADVGIFARDIHHVVFQNLAILNSGNHGAFFADWGTQGQNTCANDNEFHSVQISGSKGYGIDIASACTGNKVTGQSTFANNSSGCYSVNPSVTMSVDASVVCTP